MTFKIRFLNIRKKKKLKPNVINGPLHTNKTGFKLTQPTSWWPCQLNPPLSRHTNREKSLPNFGAMPLVGEAGKTTSNNVLMKCFHQKCRPGLLFYLACSLKLNL